MTGKQASRPSQKQREEAHAEVTVSAESPDQRAVRETYQAWCAVNAMPEFPTGDGGLTGELILLRFLHSMATSRNWQHGTCSNAARGVAKHLMRNGLLDPRGPRTQAWLKAHLRETGKRTTRPVDALTPSEVRSHLTSPSTGERQEDDIGAELLHQRAFLVLADLLDEHGHLTVNPLTKADPERRNRPNPALRTLAALTREDFVVRPHEVRVSVAGETVIVAKNRTPEHYAMLAAAVVHGGPHPLAPATAMHDARAFDLFLRRMRRRATTVVYTVARNRTRPSARREGWAAQWWTDADREHRVRVMVMMDSGLPSRTQDAAYLLTGLTRLFRNAELVRLNVGHIVRRADGTGFDYTLAEHKSAMHAARHGSVARPLQGALDHGVGPDGTCPSICVACAMDRHLRLRSWYGAGPNDPLFVNYTSPGNQNLQRLASTQLGSRVVNQAAGTAELEDGSARRLGTRSLRVSGATWLHEDGMSYEELQEVGTWSSVLYARLYVRRYDPWASADLVLGLIGS